MCGDYKKPLILEDAPHAFIGAASKGFDVLVIDDISNQNYPGLIGEHAKFFINLNNLI